MNSIQKVSWSISLSPPGVERGRSKNCYLLNYYNVQKWESRFTLRLNAMLPRMHVISKNNTSNKSCWTLNSVQKLVGVYVYLPPERSYGATYTHHMSLFSCFKICEKINFLAWYWYWYYRYYQFWYWYMSILILAWYFGH